MDSVKASILESRQDESQEVPRLPRGRVLWSPSGVAEEIHLKRRNIEALRNQIRQYDGKLIREYQANRQTGAENW